MKIYKQTSSKTLKGSELVTGQTYWNKSHGVVIGPYLVVVSNDNNEQRFIINLQENLCISLLENAEGYTEAECKLTAIV